MPLTHNGQSVTQPNCWHTVHQARTVSTMLMVSTCCMWRWYIPECCEKCEAIVQAMYMYLCCYAIWDVGGVWSWLVVAQRKTIQAVARYDATGQVSHVLTITRQGFHHTYMSLVANSASQMQLQAPVNTTPALDLPTSKKVLDLARAVMGAGFDNNDSLCKYVVICCFFCHALGSIGCHKL